MLASWSRPGVGLTEYKVAVRDLALPGRLPSARFKSTSASSFGWQAGIRHESTGKNRYGQASAIDFKSPIQRIYSGPASIVSDDPIYLSGGVSSFNLAWLTPPS
jgi:hypothetical protein